ncbi:ras association domain-containing protein 5 isoform X2 [Protopterus annectens]|uniref:ras association domain-containing protein 5 isoform X2 n=1 Tax=Protopterus annectens TaxID=7888 RepID=UPI001CF995C5|nr:ras association domain-containing protein 5 isoform X2 [Protopterus annectens]
MKIQPAVPPSTRLPTEPDSFSPCAIAPSAMGLHPEGPLTTFDDNSEVEAFLQSLAPRERRKILRQLPSDGGWRPQQRRRGVSEATCDGKRQQAYTGHPHPTTLTRMPVLQQQHLEPGGRSTAAGVSPDACDRQPEELDCGIHQCASPNKEGAGGPIRERHQSAAVCYCGNKSSSGSLYLLSSVPGSKSLPAAAGTKGREDCGRRFSLGEPITVQGATCAVCLQHRVTTASRVLQPPGMRSEGRKNVKGPATDEHPPQHLINDYTNDLKVPPCTTAPGFQKSGRSRLRIRHESAARRAPDVRTIFEQPRDPRVKEERGEGHSFEAAFAGGQTWCDLCGKEVTLSRGGGALRCKRIKGEHFFIHWQDRHLPTIIVSSMAKKKIWNF